MAHRNANRQLKLINELLDLSKLEVNKMQLQAHESDFVPVLRGIRLQLLFFSRTKGSCFGNE